MSQAKGVRNIKAQGYGVRADGQEQVEKRKEEKR